MNKPMDYMMAAKPIVCAIEAGNDPVTEAACGLTVAPENPQAIATGILRLCRLPEEERRAMGERGRAHILKHQTYAVLAEKFLNALK